MPVVHVVYEDEDDFSVLAEVATRLGVGVGAETKKLGLGGNDAAKLRERLGTWAKTGSHLLVILDADHPPDGGVKRTWKRLRAELDRVGVLDLPDDLPPEGLVCAGPEGRVGVWLFPDNTREGALEDFILDQLVPEADPLLLHAERVIGELPERRFRDGHRRKAHLRTWLAWQKRPGAPPGRAVKEGYLEVRSTRLASFEAWLQRVFR